MWNSPVVSPNWTTRGLPVVILMPAASSSRWVMIGSPIEMVSPHFHVWVAVARGSGLTLASAALRDLRSGVTERCVQVFAPLLLLFLGRVLHPPLLEPLAHVAAPLLLVVRRRVARHHPHEVGGVVLGERAQVRVAVGVARGRVGPYRRVRNPSLLVHRLAQRRGEGVLADVGRLGRIAERLAAL